MARRAAARIASRSVGRKREEPGQPDPELVDVAVREGRELTELRRIVLGEPLRDLGEPGVVRDEWRAAGCRRLRRDHPERLREDRGDDACIREGEQVLQVPVLERPGEERGGGIGERLELVAVVAEADDHRAGVDLAHRLEQEVDALVVEELAEVDDRRRVAGEEGLEPLGVPLVGQPLVCVPRVRRVVSRLREQIRERLLAGLRLPGVDVDARRDLVHLARRSRRPRPGPP